jgi:membrane-bound serine protease (ClpP class)
MSSELVVLTDPNIAFAALVIGSLLIYVELCAPGRIVPGAVGAILVLLALSALSALPIRWWGAGLLLLAIALFALEARVAMYGIPGGIAMVAGAVLLIDSPMPEMRIRWWTAVALAIPFAATTARLVSLSARARHNKVDTESRV